MVKKKFGLSFIFNKNKKKVENKEEFKLFVKIFLKRVSKNYENVGKWVDEIYKEEIEKLEIMVFKIVIFKNKKVKILLVWIIIDVFVEVYKLLKMKMV